MGARDRSLAETYVTRLAEAADSDWNALQSGVQRTTAPSLDSLSGRSVPDDDFGNDLEGEPARLPSRGVKSSGAQRGLYRIWSFSRRAELVQELQAQSTGVAVEEPAATVEVLSAEPLEDPPPLQSTTAPSGADAMTDAGFVQSVQEF